MNCPHCGKAVKDGEDANFCPHCGSALRDANVADSSALPATTGAPVAKPAKTRRVPRLRWTKTHYILEVEGRDPVSIPREPVERAVKAAGTAAATFVAARMKERRNRKGPGPEGKST